VPAASAGRKPAKKIKASFRRSRWGVSARPVYGDPSASGCQSRSERDLAPEPSDPLRMMKPTSVDSTVSTRHRIPALTPRSEATVFPMSVDGAKDFPPFLKVITLPLFCPMKSLRAISAPKNRRPAQRTDNGSEANWADKENEGMVYPPNCNLIFNS
jgi:hypothetical protein